MTIDLGELKRKLLGLDAPLERWHSDGKTSIPVASSIESRLQGHDHPVTGYTMCGKDRLDSLEQQLFQIRKDNVPGDLVECGVWRGGMCMFMAAFCQKYGIDKKVYVCDSFEGLPVPSVRQDANMQDHLHEHLRVGVDAVRQGFIDLGISVENVEFVKGWFKDSLPALQGHQWALIRADGDMYESTMDIMTNLYPGLQSGGFMVIDDYGCVAPCAEAIGDYRKQHNITEDIYKVDWTCHAWRKK